MLRLRDGATVIATDGAGRLQECRLRHEKLQSVGAVVTHARPTPIIGVIHAVPAGRKLDDITRMIAEVGVAWLQPTVTRLGSAFARDDAARVRRLGRLEAIAIAALEQSRSGWLLDIRSPTDLAQAISSDTADVRLLLDPMAPTRLTEIGMGAAGEVTLLVGPEAGWDDAERLVDGCQPVRLGSEVVRSEHAALAAASGVLALAGRW